MASDTLNDNPTAQSDIEGNLLPGTTPAEGYLQLKRLAGDGFQTESEPLCEGERVLSKKNHPRSTQCLCGKLFNSCHCKLQSFLCDS